LFQDANLQWSLDLSRVRIDLSLIELASRTFHATSVAGEGVVFRMRHRIDPASKDEAWVQALAPIPEFPAPAVFEAHVPEPPLPDDQYNLWTVHLENVDVGVRELWVHFMKFEGQGRAQGKFRLRPARTLWVGPANLKLDSGRMTLGGREVASAVRGSIACIVHPFDVRFPVGREVLRYISADIALGVQGFRIEPFMLLGPKSREVRVEASPARLDLDLSTDRGVFRERSRLVLALDSFAVQSDEMALALRDFTLHARGKPAGLGELALRASPVELSRPGLRGRPPSVAEARASLTSSSRDTAGDWSLVAGRIDLAGIAVPDARVVNQYISSRRVRFDRGALSGSGHAVYARSFVDGRLQLQLDDLVARSGDLRAGLGGKLDLTLSKAQLRKLRGQVKLAATLSALRLEKTARGRTSLEALADALTLEAELSRDAKGHTEGFVESSSETARVRLGNTWFRGRPELRLDADRANLASDATNVRMRLGVDDFAVDDRASGLKCPWGTVRKFGARADLRLSQALADGEIRIDIDGAHTAWGEFVARGGLGLRAELDKVGLREPRGTLRFEAQGRNLSLSSGKGPSIGWDARFSRLQSSGTLVLGREPSGSLRLSSAKVQGRIGKTTAQSDVTASARIGSLNLARQRAKFSAGVELERTRVNAGDETVEGWWARIRVESGLITAKDNLDISLPFRAKLRDALPGLRVLGAEDELPGWVADAVPLRELDVTGIAQRRCRLTDIRFTHTSGGPLTARGRIQSVPDETRGAFLVRFSAMELLSAGVRFDASSTDVSLFAGDDWFSERGVDLDRAARSVLEGPCTTPSRSCESASEKRVSDAKPTQAHQIVVGEKPWDPQQSHESKSAFRNTVHASQVTEDRIRDW
jgi:hypothetical protein